MQERLRPQEDAMNRIDHLNRRLAAKVLPSVLVLFVGALGCIVAYSQEPSPAAAVTDSVHGRLTPVDLERAFWECDYAVTTSGVGLGEGAMCADIHEELKQRKFAGDFQAMLTWWQQRKVAEHRAVARRLGATHR